MLLSGNFGELRNNHFHSGIDIKTHEIEGKPVYAVADGFIARIKVSPVGFGKTLYIDHPNGFTTVYGHLQRFNKVIDSYIKAEQYKKESFDIDIFPGKDQLLIKKGDTIAFSGNSGSSQGPHLHFEIRDTKSEEIINPLLFGLKVLDTICPVIDIFKIYPIDELSKVNNANSSSIINIKRNDTIAGNYSADTISVSGNIAFGIETYDYAFNYKDKNGIYSIDLYIDSLLCFSIVADSFSFNETRYINSLIDYPAYYKYGEQIIQTYMYPNNELDMYKFVKNKGVYPFNDNNLHHLTYKVRDFFGNTSTLTAMLISQKPIADTLPTKKNSNPNVIFDYQHSNIFKTNYIKIELPENCLYDSLSFEYSTSCQLKKCFSRIHHVHNSYTPVYKNFSISIKPECLPKKFIDKALIARLSGNNHWIPEGGKYNNGFITTKVKSFGLYAIMIDARAPEIKSINIPKSRNISQQNTIDFIIKDDFSGIKSYRGTLNGHWILMDYDEKNNKLTYTFDKWLLNGENQFKLVVTDECNNIKSFQTKLFFEQTDIF